MGGRVWTQRDGSIGWLVFEHPERHNAISTGMWAEIPQAAERLDADPDVRVVVLRGAGEEAFVSGADISEFEATRFGEAARNYDRLNSAAYAAIEAIAKPVVAMIHGFCIGGGSAIALHADLRHAADDACFGIPAAKLGLGYSPSGIETLLRTVSLSSAKAILFTAQRFGAAEALRMGLVDAVWPKAQLENAVRELAQTIAANAPLSLRAAKLACRELAKPASERELAAAQRAVEACADSADYREGVRAFLDKRRPVFQGR